jgi:hypothetical protein
LSLLGSLEERMRRTSANAAVACFPSLQSGDFTQIDAYLKEVVKDDEVTAVRLLDANGKVVREKLKADNGPGSAVKSVSMKTPVVSSGEKVGEVAINYNAEKINQNIYKNAAVISVINWFFILIGLDHLSSEEYYEPCLIHQQGHREDYTGDLTTPVPDLRRAGWGHSKG